MGNRGFTIIEVLVATALMGVAALGMAELFTGQNRQIHTIQVKANLDQLRNVVQSSAKDPDTILYTAQKTDPAAGGALMNPQLSSCVFSTGPSDPNLDCTEGWSPAPDVRLFSRDGHEVTGFYTWNGVHCAKTVTASSVTCPFQVSATFRPACPLNAALTIGGLCARAQTVQIGWKIEQKTELPSFPHQNTIQANFVDSTSSAYAVPVSTQNIKATANVAVNCPPITLTAGMLTSASPIPPGKFDSAKYSNLVGQQFPQTVTSVDAYGQQVCGIDEGALEAESLKTEVCKLWVQNVWKGLLGTYIQQTVPTCDLQIKKTFKLGGVAGSSGKNSDDCPAHVADPNYNYLLGGAVLQASDVYHQAGGVFQHLNGAAFSAAEVTSAMTMYSLNAADSIESHLICNKPVTQDKYWPNSLNNPRIGPGNSTFTLGSGFKAGSLSAYVIGGGGGGGGGSWPFSNGDGGGASAQKFANPYNDAAAGQTCFVSLGSGGGGGGTGDGGGGGGSSSFYCGTSPNHIISTGGPGSASGGQTGSNATYMGKTYNGTGNSGSAGQGAGGNCGAGGGGGHHDHSGGSGAVGCGYVSWIEIYNVEWTP